jgi:hypothetical protein
MGKTFTHPQPHWLPLHELPFLVQKPKTTSAATTKEEERFLYAILSNDLLKDKCNRILQKYKVNKGFRFSELNIDKKHFIFEYNDPVYNGSRSDAEIIYVDIEIIADKHSFTSGCLFGLGADVYPCVKAVWEAAVDHFLAEMPAGFSLWARPSNPRADFIRIEASSIRFYRTSELIGGILLCDGIETLFDARIEREGPPETELASEEQAIDFAAAELKRSPDMSKDDLRTALGTSYLAYISDRRMNSWIWPEARARAGLDKRARAGRKPGKSNR